MLCFLIIKSEIHLHYCFQILLFYQQYLFVCFQNNENLKFFLVCLPYTLATKIPHINRAELLIKATCRPRITKELTLTTQPKHFSIGSGQCSHPLGSQVFCVGQGKCRSRLYFFGLCK